MFTENYADIELTSILYKYITLSIASRYYPCFSLPEWQGICQTLLRLQIFLPGFFIHLPGIRVDARHFFYNHHKYLLSETRLSTDKLPTL